MNKLYRFSPIKTRESFLEAVGYVASETTKMCQKITGNKYSISSLTIFSHYINEFESLQKILLEMGELKAENNGPYVKLHNSIKLPFGDLSFLRVRKPDPYRMQVGCNDFEVPDYEQFKSEFLDKGDGFRLIEREEYEMIEFFDPDFVVLAYVLSKPLL